MDRIEQKINKLRKLLKGMGSVVVACSGGIDSSFLLKVAGDELGEGAVSATALSEVYIKDDYRLVKKLVRRLGVRQIDFRINLLGTKDFFSNSSNRCYFCKKEMFGELRKIAKAEKVNYIVDGTNQDDILEFRPGRKAIKELGIMTPLVEAGFNKKDIRLLSRKMGLSGWERPSSTCLATRVPCGEEINLRKLKMIEQGERFIKGLISEDLRLRHCQGDIAGIEVSRSDAKRLMNPRLKNRVEARLKKIGYNQISINVKI
ncbi:MAG: ATP-dependent sacrificial sulfur transferase LarE [Candidatus Omnitrophota bacterium]|nr:ATP-dependent sacrificial sulfur transferase LarE [Candidatus Omnitrophota bacterium]